MEVKLYKNTSETTKLDKTLSLVSTFNDVVLKDGSSVLDPTIILESTASLAECNYMIIPSFNRNYFITDIQVLRGSNTKGRYLYAVYAHVDVLTTYKAEIRAQHAIIGRQENSYNVLLDDSQVPMLSKPLVTQQDFPSGFAPDARIVLMTSGNK